MSKSDPSDQSRINLQIQKIKLSKLERQRRIANPFLKILMNSKIDMN